jgi:hypothetical protein
LGVVKPRALAHDAQVYRAFKEEAGRIEAEAEDGRITRVVLDYELKRDYQRFLNRENRPDDATVDSDRQAFNVGWTGFDPPASRRGGGPQVSRELDRFALASCRQPRLRDVRLSRKLAFS